MIFNQMSKAVSPIMEKIHDQNFNRELAQGTLPQEKFIYYLIQDALYLADFSRALALTGARLPQQDHTQQFIHFALEAIKAERELHINYLKKHSLTNFSSFEHSPECFMYTNYLLRTASTGAVEEAVASLLPCFWVYREVGCGIASQKTPNNSYQNWIDLYSSEAFDESVQSAITITNELAAKASNSIQEKMINAFIRSTQLEWLFWDGAYKQSTWNI